MDQEKRVLHKVGRITAVLTALWLLVFSGCQMRVTPPAAPTESMRQAPTPSPQSEPTEPVLSSDVADVLSVRVTGSPGAYQFSVEVKSPDTGCEQYADWWEVLDEQGSLLYRRILAHSHTGEQPFVRSGGPVPIEQDTPVWVRAHMHPQGYGGAAFRGTVADGLSLADLDPGFASDVADQSPLPDGCAF